MNRLFMLLIAVSLLISGCSSADRKENGEITTVDNSQETTVCETTAGATQETTVDATTADGSDITTEVTTTESKTETEPVGTTEETVPDVTPGTVSDAITSISASDAFVYNVNSGELLGIKGEGVNISPASITKLLTSLYALHAAPPDLVISPKTEELSLVGKNSSIAYIKTYHKLTVSQLIQGMLMPSGNDAAYALAAGIGRYIANDPNLSGKEAVELFMKGLNEYASEIGCNGTYFSVPDGLAYTDHYTSVHDLIIIGKLAVNNPIISKYAKTVSEKVYYVSSHSITWKNSNLLIDPKSEYYSPYVNGLKTGSLKNNYSIYVSAVINDNTYLMGIFGSPTKDGRYDDAHVIINAILENVKEAG